MNKAGQLYEDYQKALKELQDTCPHEHLNEYAPEYWAPGHCTNRSVQSCKECNKVVNTRKSCNNCWEYVYNDFGYEGDGQKVPYGMEWCSKECAFEAVERAEARKESMPVSRIDICMGCKNRYERDKGVRKKIKGYFRDYCSQECADEG